MANSRTYYAYIRVSTAKQGSRGVSLQEQKFAIEHYANKNGLEISEWFEERVTAAKRGRALFGKMLSQLQKGKVDGVIIHKIDRSARNLRDWADLGELIDSGVKVLFANEGLDMASRGGRLSADIQAVVAADYIRNLREEARKGIYGRLKQGYYPLQAPIGYLDCGGGKVKKLDPVKAPLVRRLFLTYATERHNLNEMVVEAQRIGLTNRRGGVVSKNGIWKTLRNPFYTGVMHIKRTNKTYNGLHEPLVSNALFNQVQEVLTGRSNTKIVKHEYTFRRLFKCSLCGYSVIGEYQKGNIYYRCHTSGCPTTSVREEWIHRVVSSRISSFSFPSFMIDGFRNELEEMGNRASIESQNYIKSLSLRRKQLDARLSRLTDLIVEDKIDEQSFDSKRNSLVREQVQLVEKIAAVKSDSGYLLGEVKKILELATNASLTYGLGSKHQKRTVLENVTSNRLVSQKKVFVELREPFKDLVHTPQVSSGGVQRDVPRTCRAIIDQLVEFVRRRDGVDDSPSP